MTKQKPYYIVSNYDINKFEDKINQKISEGYYPIGELKIYDKILIQSMMLDPELDIEYEEFEGPEKEEKPLEDL